jgi:hypothetical protein
MDVMGKSLVLSAPAEGSSLKQRWPDAAGFGYAEGWRWQLQRELKIRERRGEIIPMWWREEYRRGGIYYVPVVFLKTPGQIRLDKLRRAGHVVIPATVALAGVGWLVWEARYAIGALLLLLTAGALCGLALPHWSRGCTGIHCPGCRG